MKHTGKSADGFLHQCEGCGTVSTLAVKYPNWELIPISADAKFSPQLDEEPSDENPLPDFGSDPIP